MSTVKGNSQESGPARGQGSRVKGQRSGSFSSWQRSRVKRDNKCKKGQKGRKRSRAKVRVIQTSIFC